MNVPNTHTSPTTPVENARQLEADVLQHAVTLAQRMAAFLNDTCAGHRDGVLSDYHVLNDLEWIDRCFTKQIKSISRAHQGLVKTLRLMEQLYPED